VIRSNAAQKADHGSVCARPHPPEFPDEDGIAPAKATGLISSESGKRNEFIGHAIFQILLGMALLTTLTWCGAVWAQEPPAPPASPQLETNKNVTAPCVEPPPIVRWEDYQGPFKKVVGVFARKLERKAVHPPHFKPGAVLCTLDPKDKLTLFVQDAFDPVTFLVVGFNAGLGQAGDQDPTFGQGTEGFGKRFGAHFVDQASGDFF
jgi:hypothetical protein